MGNMMSSVHGVGKMGSRILFLASVWLCGLTGPAGLAGLGNRETPGGDGQAAPVRNDATRPPLVDLQALLDPQDDAGLPANQAGTGTWWPWSRTDGALVVQTSQPSAAAGSGGTPAADLPGTLAGLWTGPVTRLEHRAGADWAWTCPVSCPAQPGEAWVIWAMVRRLPGGTGQDQQAKPATAGPAGAGTIHLAVTTRTASRQVVEWDAAAASPRPGHDWQLVRGWVAVPADGAELQLRFSGQGRGVFEVCQMGIARVRAPQDLASLPVLELPNPQDRTARLVLDLPASRLRLANRNREWVFNLGDLAPACQTARLEPATAAAPASLVLEFRDPAGNLVAGRLAWQAGGVELELQGQGPLGQAMAFPGQLEASPGDSWALPINQGLLVPAHDPWFATHDLVLYGGHGLCMPFFSLGNDRDSLLVIARTADDARIHFDPPSGSRGSRITLLWEPSRQEWRYTRRARLVPLDGDYNAAAGAYRAYVQASGGLVTLAQKARTVPRVQSLYGAVNLWWWQNGPWWTQDSHEGVLRIARELKSLGIDRVLWSHEQEGRTVTALNDLGFLTGKYDIYQDVWGPDNPHAWVNHEGWPEALVHQADGSLLPGWVDKGPDGSFAGGVICSSPGLELAKVRVPADLANHPYGARFIDTTTASPLRECWNPRHPQSRSDDRAAKMALLNLMSSTHRLVTGSETGTDMAVPYVHYFEGMMSLGPYRLEDSGYDLFGPRPVTDGFRRFQTGPFYRIPLFELVYHDCVLNSWYWGDASNRVLELWDERDMLNALYGTLPLWALDPQIWQARRQRFVQSWRNATPVSRQTAGQAMTSHRFVDPAHEHQATCFADGTRVLANFGRQPWPASDPGNGIQEIPARSFLALFPDGRMLRSWEEQ